MYDRIISRRNETRGGGQLPFFIPPFKYFHTVPNLSLPLERVQFPNRQGVRYIPAINKSRREIKYDSPQGGKRISIRLEIPERIP